MTQSPRAAEPYPHLFSPLTVGPMALKSRVMLPPHFSAIGNLWGSAAEAERTIAYLEERAEAGVAWITITGRVGNHFIPGFEPSGLSAETLGFFRLPQFADRCRMVVERMARHGTHVIIQMTMIGGYPNAPSNILSNPIANAYPHVMSTADIDAMVAEYRLSARRVAETPLAGVELHFNHDDLVEQFISPLTNNRIDEYGGSFDNRLRFARRIIAAVREELPDRAIGVRLNAFEEMPGGYNAGEGIRIAQALTVHSIDYLSVVIGSHWGNPSYIQTQQFEPAQWADRAGAIRKAVSLPVVYTGMVDHPDRAERILREGYADVVGIARAHVADGQFLAKAREGRADLIRPCIAANDCINRRYVDGLPFGCAVNTFAAKELEGPFPRAKRPTNLLVIGGGPAGMELAALAAESGHRVRLWEAAPALGGQLRLAIEAPHYERMAHFLRWQQDRLARAGVEVELNRRAVTADVADADVVALATGALPRRPPVPGAETALEARDILAGRVTAGKRVLLIAEEDHLQPLALADYLSSRGHDVVMLYATTSPAILLGRYSNGGPLGRLDEQGVRIRCMERAVAIHTDGAEIMNIYSKRKERLAGFDSVALACGGTSDAELYATLSAQRDNVHLLGDAFAPRRMVFATRQARALALLLAEAS
ncbi:MULTISPECIES: FAD-dependent oxidoreductase [unclassified Chelatococcus]|uniref:oxidoreductase n=1 Tax=unclassified Chelatococcus TaxID=2638111 RepID=UPI001BCADEA5|nr:MULTISPECIES: FAD-dependent oxidoreductase [unclassified Chelatococcus]MBS7700243.1 FAD-dependent oxidoreductase [Chelatococcus sp. YT9]MBX3558214.1 FAD-dependent oxidoreductase [Chelatococcus sp.]